MDIDERKIYTVTAIISGFTVRVSRDDLALCENAKRQAVNAFGIYECKCVWQ